jgi:hypothetical protein
MAVIATTAQLPARSPIAPDGEPGAIAAAVPAAAAAIARRDAARTVASATRTQQTARSAASRRATQAEVRVASAAAASPVLAQALTAPASASHVASNPFAHPQTLQARPWPRSVLSGGGNTLNASLEEGVPATFYPFEPRQSLPAPEPEREQILLPQR